MAQSLIDLPTELKHEILSYLAGIRSSRPRNRFLYDCDERTTGQLNRFQLNHPYNSLAASCRALRDIVETYCRHLLRKCADEKLKVPKIPWRLENGIKSEGAKPATYRKLWLSWSRRNCAFCGKATVCRALFNTDIQCCRKCDRVQWPDKITMTNAMQKYQLSKLDLFSPNPLYDGVQAPRVRIAYYDCMGVDTHMFLTHEVERLAAFVHGDDSQEDKKARLKRRTGLVKHADKLGIVIYAGRWCASGRYKGRDLETGVWPEEVAAFLRESDKGFPLKPAAR